MLNELWNIINTKVGVAAVTLAASIFGNVVYNRWRIRKEQKVGFENVIGTKIATALEAIRDIELTTTEIEAYDIDGFLNEKRTVADYFGGSALFPGIMSDSENLNKFLDNINLARKNHEKYVDHTVAAHLLYMERYIMDLMKYAGGNSLPLDLLGAVVISDFQKWQKSIDRQIVKRLNRPKYKISTETGLHWEYAKKRIKKRLQKSSILYGLISDDSSLKIRVSKAILFNQPNAPELVKEFTKKHY